MIKFGSYARRGIFVEKTLIFRLHISVICKATLLSAYLSYLGLNARDANCSSTLVFTDS
jgi:hypothetical protein